MVINTKDTMIIFFYIYNYYVYNLFIIIPAQAHMTIIKQLQLKQITINELYIEVYNDSEHFRETQLENEIERSIHYLISHYYLILNRPIKAYNEVIVNAISPNKCYVVFIAFVEEKVKLEVETIGTSFPSIPQGSSI